MGRRWKTEELEADLYKVPMPRFWRVEKGEIERTTYEDGEEKLEITFRLPGGVTGNAQLQIAGDRVCEVEVVGGRARQVLSTTRGEVVPKAQPDDVVEIAFGGEILLAGVFRPD